MTETLLSKKQTCALQSEHIVFLLLKKVAVKSILNVCQHLLLPPSKDVFTITHFQTRMLFVETPYTLATEEAERIGVDHVARLSNTGTVDSSTGTFYILLYYPIYLFSMQTRKDNFDLMFPVADPWLCFCFPVSEHLLAQYNAIKMLHSRVKMILEYAKAVKNGNTHSLLLCA